jgi:type II secretory pathway pseudopilin PulG
MKSRPQSSLEWALTRVELLVLLGVLSLLASTVWPTLANSTSRADRLSCVNNLRQIGRAFQVWASDNNGENPWRVPKVNGGTMDNALAPNAWFHYSYVSNFLGAPRILVCPSDVVKLQKVAADWGPAAAGGFLNVAYRNNSVSYPLGLHTAGALPQTVLSGDRNLRWAGKNACGLVPLNNTWYLRSGDASAAWTNGSIHGASANLLLNGGQVLQDSGLALSNALNQTNVSSESGTFHFLAP